VQIEQLTLTAASVAVLLWAGLSFYVLHIDRRRTAARSIVGAVLTTLESPKVRHAAEAERVDSVGGLLEQVSRDMVLHTAADGATPPHAAGTLIKYLVDRWGIYTIVREATSHRRSHDIWRRTASLKILFQIDHPQAIELLQRAVDDESGDVASVGLTLLGRSSDPRAIGILIAALRQHRYPASRIAVHLEHSPLRPAEEYRALIADRDPVVRFWGATLLAQFPDVAWVERSLATLMDDPDARVRKAAVQSLGKVGDQLAASVAMRLLRDEAPFVRAHAAKALGELEHAEAAAAVAELLGDADWWVRAAAKQSLEMMGSEVWPVLMRCLDHQDGFVRNGAAEVFQNLGVLDSLIVMEAATDDPSSAKIDLLRRIAAAGGMRLTDSLIERAGEAAAPRIRRLLATMGLEQVGAA
jgi:HEAT repeat protein